MAEKKFLDANGVKQVKEDYEKKIGANLEGYLKKEEIDTALAEYAKDEDLTAYLKTAEIDTALTEYVKDEELADYVQTSVAETTYVKNADLDGKIKTAVGTVYHPKGSLENLEAIKAVESPAEGDVYNATDTGANYVYVGGEDGVDGTGWDKLSETIDLSSYATTDSLADYAKTASVDEKLAAYAKTADLPEALTEEEIQEILNPPVI